MEAAAIRALAKRLWPFAAGAMVLAALAFFYFAWRSADARADRLAVEVRAEQALRAAAERRTATLEKAANERATDGEQIATIKEELTDAIDKAAAAAPGAAPGPATVALGCARLRTAGRTASAQYRRICGGR